MPLISDNGDFPGTIKETKLGPLSDSSVIYNSYAGTDIVATIVAPGEGPLTLGEVATLSYSIHRENTPVRFLGRVNPAGFIKGPRLISGSMIFTVFNFYAFYKITGMRNAIQKNLYPVADMLPPFDVVLTFANENGVFSKMKLYGLTIIDEGGTMSVDDLITEMTLTYMARGIQPLTPIYARPTTTKPPQLNQVASDSETDLPAFTYPTAVNWRS